MRLRLFLYSIFLPILALAQTPRDWYGDKYSMFVHYGLYSTFGGVFDGEPVRQGYSEQILTFGVHFSDWYEEAAKSFAAESFDADSIALLAKSNGMRSVVLTSKHHDGFCLFRTATTSYNAYDGTPAHRDLLAEMSEACKRHGLGFGIYFSLIDWHYPYAVPFTSHNADPITPEHHRHNLAQVTELLSNYGPVDELWFDMGSLASDQSRELYELVHRLQPGCMVSGRLGNDYADFSVMADNELPDYAMELPWQTAASIFPETWGYRSWQDRSMPPADKASEKLGELIRVLTLGGKYLLNIGPMGDGGVVPYEAEVLREMGAFLDPVKEAVYGTCPARFVPDATLSSDHRRLYLFVKKGTASLTLPPLSALPTEIRTLKGGKTISYIKTAEGLSLTGIPDEGPWTVVGLTFDEPVTEDFTSKIVLGTLLTSANAEALYTHSSADYYASFRSIAGYRWITDPFTELSVRFTEAEAGRTVSLNGSPVLLSPQNGTVYRPALDKITFDAVWKNAPGRGLFGKFEPEKSEFQMTSRHPADTVRSSVGRHGGELYRLTIQAEEELTLPVRFDFSDGLLVSLNGASIDGALQREGDGSLVLMLPLGKGENILCVKNYNLTSDHGAWFRMTPLSEITLYELPLRLAPLPEGTLCQTTEIKRPHAVPFATPAHLSNVSLIRR